MNQPYGQPPPSSSPWGPAAPGNGAPPPGAYGQHPHAPPPHGAQPGYYGAPHAAYGYPVVHASQVKSLSDRSNVWLIVSIAGFWLGFWVITGPLSWIMAGRVRREYQQLGLPASGAATAAWVIGIVTSLFGIFAIAMGILFAFVIFAAI